MYKLKVTNWLISSFVIVVCLFPFKGNVYAQATKQHTGDVTCPASGTSIEVLAQNSGRFSMLFNNINGNAVRIGYVGSGTAALTASNSWVLQPGQAVADSLPNVNSGRVVCMSTTANSNLITFYEGYR